ncbi:tyrosine-type recombinase/integrase [Nocardioides sp. BYT-33-1]|uniref:tyrosine-type recombinase/integrase n=1 Tax=Nocardioides sp. BYT-33-1 TaxID=3416952 RepID=UPI003F53E36E
MAMPVSRTTDRAARRKFVTVAVCPTPRRTVLGVAKARLGTGTAARIGDISTPVRAAVPWSATREAAGLSTRLHALRHFYASGLIASGCDVVAVQTAMGHSTATTTLNTYSHLWPTAEDRTRNAASRLAKAILGDSWGTERVN